MMSTKFNFVLLFRLSSQKERSEKNNKNIHWYIVQGSPIINRLQWPCLWNTLSLFILMKESLSLIARFGNFDRGYR